MRTSSNEKDDPGGRRGLRRILGAVRKVSWRGENCLSALAWRPCWAQRQCQVQTLQNSLQCYSSSKNGQKFLRLLRNRTTVFSLTSRHTQCLMKSAGAGENVDPGSLEGRGCRSVFVRAGGTLRGPAQPHPYPSSSQAGPVAASAFPIDPHYYSYPGHHGEESRSTCVKYLWGK